MEKATMSVKEMANYIGIGLTNAYALVSTDNFYPAFRIGRKILINRDLLDRWLTTQHDTSFIKEK